MGAPSWSSCRETGGRSLHRSGSPRRHSTQVPGGRPGLPGGIRDLARSPRLRGTVARMTPQEMKQLAELLQKVPGIKSIELKDVEGLAQLLRDAPEIGSIEVKGFFGTGVVITRTSAAPAFAPVAMPTPLLAPPLAAVPAESDG